MTYNLIFLVVIGFAVYAFNLANPLFWDDDEWIKGNVFVHDFSHLKEIFTQNILSGFGLNSNYWRPLLLLSFAANYVLGGIEPLGYHLLSNGFHIANGVLIFLLLTGVINRRAATLAAILFLIHPLQTEAVTYISGRGDPMSVFFMLLALWFYVLGQRLGRPIVYGTLALASMILAILSRETAVLFPVILMIYYMAFLAAKPFLKSFKAALISSLPYWIVAGVYLILRLTIFNFKNTLNFYSQANDYTQHLGFRLFTFGHALVEYFRLVFWPLGLHMERDLALKTSLFQWPVWLAALIILLILVVLAISYKLKAKSYSVGFFGWGWFFAALLPVSGIIPINAILYEHWLYLPLVGFATLAAFYIDRGLEFLKIRKLIAYNLLLMALFAYLSFFTVVSAKRNIAWGDPIGFYEDILKYNPHSIRVLNNLGNIYSERGNLDRALEMYQRAVASPSGNIFAQPHYNLGNIYRDRKETDKAISQYQKAIEVDPKFPFPYQNLAVIYADRGELNEAALMLEKVKELRPNVPRLYYNLGLVYLAQNKRQLAVDNLMVGLKLSDNDPEVKSAIKSLLDKLK